MFDTMTQAKNAIEVYNAALNVHNANIANMSVPGYKRLDVTFQSILEKISSMGSPASSFSNIGGTNPKQFGQGVGIGQISVDFTQGSFTESSNSIDLAIDGRGFFIVTDDGGATYKYTRAGKFQIDSGGNLLTANGMQVYGLNSGGALAPITGLTGALTSYGWNSGTGELLNSDGSTTGYRIALTYFNNAGGLQQSSGTTFMASLASGAAATPISTGGGAGNIQPRQLEQSNVFYLGESVDALEIQRAMSANLSTVKAASDMISAFISKLG